MMDISIIALKFQNILLQNKLRPVVSTITEHFSINVYTKTNIISSMLTILRREYLKI